VVKQDDRIKKENLKTMYHKIWSGFMKRNGKKYVRKGDDENGKENFKTMYHKIWSGFMKRSGKKHV
jgi:hypothetical protein